MPARRTPNKLDLYSRESVMMREASRLFHLGPPWVAWLGVVPVAMILHKVWPQPAAAALGLICAALLSFGSSKLTHQRKGTHGKLMAPVSFALLGLWLAWVDLAGVKVTLLGVRYAPLCVWFVGGVTGAWYWSHWLHARDHEESGSFAKQFIKAAAELGHEDVKVLSMEPLPDDEGQGLEGFVKPPPGMTAAEWAKELPHIEAKLGAPVGSLTSTVHLPDASQVKMGVSNPQILEGVQPWPGPSLPGESIAKPVRTGRHANGKAERYVVVNDHVQVMGKSGSGKSFGFAWNEDAEQFTRRDAAVMAADITKADQTLGPMREGLHRIEITADGIADLLEGIHRAVPVRTAALTARGYNRWFEGCGITHLTVNLEETPDIVDLLDDADLIRAWLSDIKAGRSAGIRWRLSLQRSTFDQMPTIVRAQLSRVCFGLADDGDADYGLSDVQLRAKCHPGDWGHKWPGKHYIDVPGMPDDLVTVEARSFGWGDASKDGGVEGARMMAAHCAKYPARLRPLDIPTLEAMAAPVSPSSAIPTPAPAAKPKEQAMTDWSPDHLRAFIEAMADGTIPADPAQREEAQKIMAANRPHAAPDMTEEQAMTHIIDEDYEPDRDLDADLAEAGTGEEAGLGEDFDIGDGAPDRPPASPEEAERKLREWLDRMRRRNVATFGLDEWVDLLEEVGRGESWLRGKMRVLERERVITGLPTRPKTWRLERAA
jgi:hypothetical protein